MTSRGERADKPILYTFSGGPMPGFRMRVEDIVLQGEDRQLMASGSRDATHRQFVQADEARWTYAFESGESRDMLPETLERQIARAKYSAPDYRSTNPR